MIEALGHDCAVIAPSLIPNRPGDRVKTNRRDAEKLARLFRAGELTEIWTPDPAREAMRDLVRTREAAVRDRTRKRQEIRSFLLRHGRIYPGLKGWGTKYFRWLQDLSFPFPAQHAVLQELILAESQCRERVGRLEQAIEDGLRAWHLTPLVEHLQALRGVRQLPGPATSTKVASSRSGTAMEQRSFDFHKEEFNSLKTEIAGLVASTIANLQYAIALSGVIFAWLLAIEIKPERFQEYPLSLAWFVPGAIAVTFAIATAASYIRIRQMGAYLRDLERAYADPDLGWEKYFTKHAPPHLFAVYVCAWLLLIIGDFWFAYQVGRR